MAFPTRATAWSPSIAAQFIEPLIVTAKNLVERDQAEALVWASSDITLKPFQHILYARRDKTFYESRVSAFPLLVLSPGRTRPPFGEEERSIPDELNEIAAEIVIAGSDADNLTLQITRYVKAVDLIWRSASYADLTWNLVAGHTTKPVTDVVEHGYSVIAEDGPNSYLHTASLTLTAQFMEV